MKKQHYFLVAGQVIFHTQDGEHGQIMLNTLASNSERTFPARMLGRAQQALQMRFFQQVNDPTVTVDDVPIYAISYMGYMSEKEFNAPPQGMKLQEKAPADPFADGDKPSTVVDLSQVN